MCVNFKGDLTFTQQQYCRYRSPQHRAYLGQLAQCTNQPALSKSSGNREEACFWRCELFSIMIKKIILIHIIAERNTLVNDAQILNIIYRPPFKSLNNGGQIFFMAIPIPVPTATTIMVGIKYCNRENNVFFIGKNLIQIFETTEFNMGE